MPQSKPTLFGVSFIVHSAGDRKDTWSKALRFCGNAETVYKQLVEGSPGLRGQLAITKYENGKVVSTYDLEE